MSIICRDIGCSSAGTISPRRTPVCSAALHGARIAEAAMCGYNPKRVAARAIRTNFDGLCVRFSRSHPPPVVRGPRSRRRTSCSMTGPSRRRAIGRCVAGCAACDQSLQDTTVIQARIRQVTVVLTDCPRVLGTDHLGLLTVFPGGPGVCRLRSPRRVLSAVDRG